MKTIGKAQKILKGRVDLLQSPAKCRGIQIVGANFHSKNSQGAKLHITIHFLFAKAKDKIISTPLI
jgi:hypothetical protein